MSHLHGLGGVHGHAEQCGGIGFMRGFGWGLGLFLKSTFSARKKKSVTMSGDGCKLDLL